MATASNPKYVVVGLFTPNIWDTFCGRHRCSLEASIAGDILVRQGNMACVCGMFIWQELWLVDIERRRRQRGSRQPDCIRRAARW